jgi:hypothetical protein
VWDGKNEVGHRQCNRRNQGRSRLRGRRNVRCNRNRSDTDNLLFSAKHSATPVSYFQNDPEINFAAVTISLAIADYALAAIVTPQNAYAICGARVMSAVLFGCTVVWFFKSILELLDLQVSIAEIVRNYSNDTHSKLFAFEQFIADLESKVVDLKKNSIHKIGHDAEHDFLNYVEPIAELADGCVES